MNETKCFMDTDVIVNAFIDMDDKKSKASRELLEKLGQGKVSLVTDYLVLTEAHYVISKYKGVQKASEVIRKLITFHTLEVVAIDSYTFFEALKKAAKYQLKMNDLIHYTIALLKNASKIYSYDRDFKGLEIERIEP